ncbi:MAG: endonuclease/exonuclease/phosphatase family protein [Alphaproteobacteria bacterium]|nr:endonuclease/exonuclease/phosphatase family protein [Alphaproteobacteria bacterium]
MVAFAKPGFSFSYVTAQEISALQSHRTARGIPNKQTNRLLVATWNIANFGVQERRDSDHALIAEMLGWFDLAALQEVGDNVTGLKSVLAKLPPSYRTLFSDRAGNNERMAFVYDSSKVTLLEKVGEVAVPPASHRYITLPGIEQKYRGFDRNPYLAAFQAGGFRFLLVNVHLYFGSDSTRDKNRRRLETYAVARWADLRRKSGQRYVDDIIVLGDFNLPKAVPGDGVYEALTKRGLHLPAHTSQVGSAIASDNHYDQIAFFPGNTQADYVDGGVFDFDAVVFSALWNDPQRSKADFIAYARYYLSDHRPLWAEFQI